MYVDGFLLPIPKKKLATYRKMAEFGRKLWMEHGALQYVEAVEDDVPPGKLTSFPLSVKLKKGEVVVFSFITYKSRKHRDAVNKKVFTDPRMKKWMDPKKMPFDGKRMIWGGFKVFVKA